MLDAVNAAIIIQLSNAFTIGSVTETGFLHATAINSIFATLFWCYFNRKGRTKNFLKNAYSFSNIVALLMCIRILFHYSTYLGVIVTANGFCLE